MNLSLEVKRERMIRLRVIMKLSEKGKERKEEKEGGGEREGEREKNTDAR